MSRVCSAREVRFENKIENDKCCQENNPYKPDVSSRGRVWLSLQTCVGLKGGGGGG